MGFFSELYTHIKGEPKQYDYKFSNGVELIDKENSTDYIIPSIINDGSSSVNTFINSDNIKQTDINVRTKFFIGSSDIEYQYQHLHILSNLSDNPLGYVNSDDTQQYKINVPDDAILCCSGFKNVRCNSHGSSNYYCSDMTILKKDKFKNMLASLGTKRFFNFLPGKEALKIPKSISKYLKFQKDEQGFKSVCFQGDVSFSLNYDSVEHNANYLFITPCSLQSSVELSNSTIVKEMVKNWTTTCLQKNDVELDLAIKGLSNHNQPKSIKSKISLKPKSVIKKIKSIAKTDEEYTR